MTRLVRAIVLVFLFALNAPATTFARGSTSASDAIWQRLADYRGSFLRHWRDTLDAPTSSPADVVDALHELVLAVNGPGGFWRKTVARTWLGCGEDPGSEPCLRLAQAEAELAVGDALLRELEALHPRQAAGFLGKHEARILAWLDTCVPRDASARALRAVPLYRAHLREVLEDRIGSARLSDSEL